MPVPIPPEDPRTRTELEVVYRLERELADRLRAAPPEDRAALYGPVYDEYFRRVHHPRDPDEREQVVRLEEQLLASFLRPETRFLEIGAGDGVLARRIAGRVQTVVAQDASHDPSEADPLPENGRWLVGDATRLDLPPESVDLAYSSHFIEHLHPDDARTHLSALLGVLAPGGMAVCITPNRHWGPHDTSGYFGDVPTGFHLREYDHADLADLLLEVGFTRVRALKGFGGTTRAGSLLPYRLLALYLRPWSPTYRRWWLGLLSGRRQRPFRRAEQVAIAAWKP